jgi:pentatricopeptide repeat protein
MFFLQIPEFVAEKRRFLAPTEVVKNDSDRCWDVLKHMEKRGCHPNNVTCSSDKNPLFQ